MMNDYIYFDKNTGAINDKVRHTDKQHEGHLTLNPRLDYIISDAVVNSPIGKWSVDVDSKTLVFTEFDGPDHEENMAHLRSERDYRLKQSDFTQFTDAPFSTELKDAYAVYRQQLRDLPAQYPNIEHWEDIVWPVRPS